MKVFVALAALCVCANASLLPAATIATKLVSTGESSQSRTQDAVNIVPNIVELVARSDKF